MYQVLTNQGFKNFESFLNQGMSSELLKITFSDNTILKCTAEHQLLLDDEYIEAQFLIIGDIISGKEIFNIESIDNEIVYDLLNVEDTNAYYTNGVMSHNCSFVYIDECLDKNTLIRIKNKNGFEFDISIGSFYNLLSEENNTNDYIINTKNYSVLTKTGFQKIDGIKKSFSSDNVDIYFDDETIFTCTSYHFIEKDYVFLPACLLNVGDIINNKKIIQIRQNKKTIEVYDLVNVANGNSYYTDGINSHNCAFLDNWTDFYASVFPTLTSGEKTKMLFTSTPCGMNHFYEFWEGATKGLPDASGNLVKNGFYPIFAPWYRIPGRGEKFKETILKGINYDYDRFRQEYEGEFLGSSGSLLNATVLKDLISSVKEPIARNDYLTQYESPIKDHIYFLIADVSRGKGLDYSAFSIIDVTTIPYKQVCVYRNNRITPADYASVIKHVATMYNMAYVVVEINDLGGQVTYILRTEYDYENLMATESAGRAGKKLSAGFGNSVEDGIRTTISTKRLGCQVLKLLLEQHKLLLSDNNTVKELQTFSKSGESYEAESGFHDDLVMGLVIFSYITQDAYFKDITNGDVVSQLRDMEEDQVTDDLIPFGIVTSPTDYLEPKYVKIPGEKGVWTEHSSLPFDDYY